MAKKNKVALALGGGGVRGLANIGVLKAFEEAGIKPDIVTGASMGAIVGSVYCQTGSAVETEEIIREHLGSELFVERAKKLTAASDTTRGFFDRVYGTARKGYFYYRFLMRQSVVSPEVFFLEMDRFLPEGRFDELQVPFACVALDLSSGLPQILHSGEIRPAVKASSAVPGMLPPVEMDGGVFVDGGWVEVVPISAARFLGADFVIGVDVSRDISPIDGPGDLSNSLDVLSRADDIARSIMNTYRTMEADFIVRPHVGEAHWSDFSNLDFYVASGARAAQDALVSIRMAKRFKRIRRILWK